MSLLRSILFALALVVVTPPFGILALFLGGLAPMARYRIITRWADVAMWCIAHILGIRYRVVGEENMPKVPAVVLAKHQSAWETIAFQHILPPVSFVLKRELLKIPFFGWGLGRMPFIAIDRAAGKDALAQLVDQGAKRMAEGFWVVVFPEGTRVAPGGTRRYKSGGAWLAHKTGAPVVPIAHNAGEFWGRNAFHKKMGEVVVSIGPAIQTEGRTAEEITKETRAWIEGEMHRLFPHHYRASRQED